MSEQQHRELPAGRYGSRARNGRLPRWARWAVAGGGVAGGLALAIVLYVMFGSSPLSGQQTSYSVLGDDRVRIDLDVTRQTPDHPAMCIVKALAQDGVEVGRKEVYVAPGAATVSLTTVVRTARRAVTGRVDVCSYQVPPYLSSAPGPTGPSG